MSIAGADACFYAKTRAVRCGYWNPLVPPLPSPAGDGRTESKPPVGAPAALEGVNSVTPRIGIQCWVDAGHEARCRCPTGGSPPQPIPPICILQLSFCNFHCVSPDNRGARVERESRREVCRPIAEGYCSPLFEPELKNRFDKDKE
jgi:hypothetical protein